MGTKTNREARTPQTEWGSGVADGLVTTVRRDGDAPRLNDPGYEKRAKRRLDPDGLVRDDALDRAEMKRMRRLARNVRNAQRDRDGRALARFSLRVHEDRRRRGAL